MSDTNRKTWGWSIMVWTCMSATGPGEIFLCQGKMNSATYASMLLGVFEPSVTKLHLGMSKNSVIFQRDNALRLIR